MRILSSLVLFALILTSAAMPAAFGESPESNNPSLVYANTLGMEFVAVKAVPNVLFCRWETRVKDFEAFCRETKRTHEKAAFPQGEDHPVVNISFNDAQEFCAWLSKKEGRKYRLPTDHEWSHAVGIADTEDAEAYPKVKGIEASASERNKIESVFPWGETWPPPNNRGNFAASLRADPYEFTSPVGSFEPTYDGLYDLAGNVWEWCDSIYEPKEHYRVLRGGSWRFADSMFLLSAFRGRGNTPTRHDSRGFRVVLEVRDGGKGLLMPVRERISNVTAKPDTSDRPSNNSKDKIQVLLVGGRGSHDWHGFHDTITPVLHELGDFQLKLTPNVDDLNRQHLAKYGVVMFYGPGGNFTEPSQEQALREFVRKGGGLVGVHATDAFKQSEVYWRLLGGRFTTHRGGEFYLRIEDNHHPVTAKFNDFKIHDETYDNEFHPEFKLHSLGRIDRGQEQQSMVWVQSYGQGRVFNTTLGHDHNAWRNEHFQRLVVRGLYWAAGRESKIAK